MLMESEIGKRKKVPAFGGAAFAISHAIILGFHGARGARGQETACWCENKEAKKNKKKVPLAHKTLAPEAKKTREGHCPLGGGAGGLCMVLVLQKVLCGFAKVLVWSANVQGSRHW